MMISLLDISSELTAFTVVRASSHEAAAKMFENHPHFAIFPGEAVEVMPVLPIPAGQGRQQPCAGLAAAASDLPSRLM